MNVLELKHATKRYGPTVALHDVSLTLEEGFVMGLVGPNGAGKTTLIKAALDLVRLSEGDVRLFETPVGVAGRSLRDRIGFVHEASYLFEDLTASQLETVLAAAYSRWSSATYAEYLDRFELDPRARIKSYSKGMKMRCALAAALSHEAELLILDEPASGLDPVVRREVREIIGEEIAKEHRSVLIATHITSDLDAIADFIVLLQKGELVRVVRKDEMEERYALCKGGVELLRSAPAGLFLGTQKTSVGFTAFTTDRAAVRRAFGSKIVLEAATVEDMMVHLSQRESI